MSGNPIKEVLLLGSDKRSLQLLSLPDMIRRRIGDSRDEARNFLEFITYQHFYQHHDLKITKSQHTEELTICDEDQDVVNESYLSCLKLILAQDNYILNYFLKIWIHKVAAVNQICHPSFILQIIECGKNFDRVLRRKIYQIIGNKGRYVLNLYPEEKYKFEETKNPWETGTLDERKSYFKNLRIKDPTLALEILLNSWAKASIREKTILATIINSTLQQEDLSKLLQLYQPFKFVKQEKPASRELKLLLGSMICRLRGNEMWNEWMDLFRPYVSRTSTHLLKKLTGNSHLHITLPKENDTFWNGEQMNKNFGLEEKNLDISIYSADSHFWLASLVEVLPFQFWCQLLNGDCGEIVQYFLTDSIFLVKINKEKKSFLLNSMIHNVDHTQNKQLLTCMSKYGYVKEMDDLLHLLDKADFENYLLINSMLLRTDLMQNWCAYNSTRLGHIFSQKVLQHLIQQCKNSKFHTNHQLGFTLSLVLDERIYFEIKELDARYQKEEWYSRFKMISFPFEISNELNIHIMGLN